MTAEEDKYKADLEAEGVEVEEEKTEEKVEEAPKVEEKPKEEPKETEEKPKEEPKEVLPDQIETKKRSIYDNYKEKKSELKSERELRENFEKENTELKGKLEALSNADTKEEKKEALDDIDELAKEINADPAYLRKLKTIFLKDVKPANDESLKKDLADFKDWKTKNQEVIEKQLFEDEFSTVLPQIKSDFPKISDEDLKSVKQSLDKLSHSKEYHDKSLDYVVFKEKENLTALISPKKKGMETKERKDVASDDFDFDPNVDITTLSAGDLAKWEKQYNKSLETEELVNDSSKGKMIM